ncbi:hypothetical protein BN873_840002 [Candidatus Competibacter denitrificans Run_A_D11]|uniref:Uncharacterized protein n=1 Tax=Candidatus Competibacter denitrificans Run_A_D11 TaxID=1400863 RepID=W6MCK6_9GAMM|nr:hypothetical protein BN873_840002 [Candidatus Competibacter denitrificans Run_A_D11]
MTRIRPHNPKSYKVPSTRCPACQVIFSVPAKPFLIECRLACPHCRAWLMITLGVAFPSARLAL